MKIAIYETVHLDWIIPLCELFSLRQDEVYLFTNILFEKDIKEALKEKYELFQWTYVDTEMSPVHYLFQLNKFFKTSNFNCIILNSVDSRHLLVYAAILYKRRGSIFLNLHDVNNFFKAPYSFKFKPLLRKIGKRLLLLKMKGFIVNAKAMKDYIEANKLTEKPVFWLPPVISKAIPVQANTTSPLIITIPGSIDEKRRDYYFVLDIFSKIYQMLPGSFELILAGRPVGNYGLSVINKVRYMIQQGIKIRHSEAEIGEEDFQNIIASTDVLLSPLKIDTTIHDNITEQYGVTKVSGNIYDAIRHAKPLIIPDSLIIPEEIQTSCLAYTSEQDIFEKIYTLITNRSLLIDLNFKAFKNSEPFSASEVAKKLSLLLDITI